MQTITILLWRPPLLPPDTFKELLRKELYRIEYLKKTTKKTDWVEYWDLKQSCVLSLINTVGLSVENILGVPERKDEMAKSYCPYCLSEYVLDLGECPDCGVKLNLFEQG